MAVRGEPVSAIEDRERASVAFTDSPEDLGHQALLTWCPARPWTVTRVMSCGQMEFL